MTVLWFLGIAWASQGVVVQVVDTTGLLKGAPQVELLDHAGTLHQAPTADDGSPPDAQGGDGTWSGIVDRVVGPQVVLAVTDESGRRWTGSFELVVDRPNLQVIPTADGSLRPWRQAQPPTGKIGHGVPPDPTWTDPGARAARAPPWGLLVWAAGVGVAALLLFWWADPGSVRGPGGTLTRVSVNGDKPRLHFLTSRARLGPLVIAGPAPSLMVQAIVLGPGRVDIDDLLRTLDGLEGRTQLVITGELEGAGGVHGEAALGMLARFLPEDVDAFVTY